MELMFVCFLQCIDQNVENLMKRFGATKYLIVVDFSLVNNTETFKICCEFINVQRSHNA